MKFPKTPEPGDLVQDYAGIINGEVNKAIREIQFETYEQFDTPIVVVTISSKAEFKAEGEGIERCLLYTSPSPRDGLLSRMPSSA